MFNVVHYSHLASTKSFMKNLRMFGVKKHFRILILVSEVCIQLWPLGKKEGSILQMFVKPAVYPVQFMLLHSEDIYYTAT